MTVSKRLRFEILNRDNHTCRYCGATAPDVKLHVDHVTPTTLPDGYEFPLPSNWESSIAQFRRSGLSTEALCAIVDVAMKSSAAPRDTFKYFCGVAWRRIREAQDMAKEILSEEATADA